MTETMLNGLMMDDYPLSLTAVVERAELLSGVAQGRLPAAGRRDPPHHDRRVRRPRPPARDRRSPSLGVGEGDRVATLMWNQPEHLEAVLRDAVDGRGDPHAEPAPASRRARASSPATPSDRAIIVDESLLERVRGVPRRPRVRARDRRLAGRRVRRGHARLRVADRRRRADAVARAGRAAGGGHVLHVGHDRPAQGRGLLAPRAGAALADGGAARRERRLVAATRSCRWCRCSTPTPGACSTRPRSSAPALVLPGPMLDADQRARSDGRRAGDADRRRADGVDGGAAGARRGARPLGPERPAAAARRRLGGSAEPARGL